MNSQSNSEPPIRVLIVNQSGFIREGLCRVVERFRDIEVVASIYCLHQLGAVAQQLRVDVALIDAQFPSQSGFDAVRQLRENGASTKAVMLSVNPSLAEVKRALRVGANGFLLRDAGVSDLETALHTAVKGGVFLCPTILKRLSEVPGLEELPKGNNMFIDATQDRYLIDGILSKALHLGILQQEQ